ETEGLKRGAPLGDASVAPTRAIWVRDWGPWATQASPPPARAMYGESELEQAALGEVHNRLGPALKLELFVRLAQVVAHSLVRDAEAHRDLLVGKSSCDQR